MAKYFQFPGWKILYRNVNIAIYSEIIGSLIFSIIATLIITKSREVDLAVILFGWVFLLVIASIPAIAGGAILSYLMFSDLKNTRLSKRRSIILGGMAAGVSTLVMLALFLYFTGIDPLLFVLTLIAVFISVFCGAWSGWKIFDYFSKKLPGDLNE